MTSAKSYALGRWEFNGLSAKCIYGVKVNNFQSMNYPHDPDDLCRCIQALRFIFGEYKDVMVIYHLGMVADHYKSEVWKRFAEHWDELITIFESEWEQTSLPKTYAFMKKIIKGEFK